MTTACVISCDNCMHNCNETDRKLVVLPCGHDFCLPCLVSLQTSSNHVCPKCREHRAELKVGALPGVDDVKRDHQAKMGFPGEKRKKCDVLIGDAIPQIKTDLLDRSNAAAHQIGKDFAEINVMDKELVAKLHHVQVFKEEVEKLELGIGERIQRIQSLKAANLKASITRREMVSRIEKINSKEDIAMVLDTKATLEHLSGPMELMELSSIDESKSLLCTIACTYAEALKTGEQLLGDTFACKLKTPRSLVELQNKPSTNAALVRELLRVPALSTELVISIVRKAEKLKESGRWNLDYSNCLAALVALADRQPSCVTLIAKPNKPLPSAAAAAVAKAAKGCQLNLRLLGSFMDHLNVNTDIGVLKQFVGNSSLRLTTFYGRLDTAGIALLPPTIITLGLVITSEADARAVSGLRPWETLMTLVVTVNCRVAVQNLKVLPRIRITHLHFPRLTDALVVSVRPAIEALLPDKLLSCLYFPSCHLTANGARFLAQQLRGIKVTCCVGLWWLDGFGLAEDAKSVIYKEFESAVGCGVGFTFNWILFI